MVCSRLSHVDQTVCISLSSLLLVGVLICLSPFAWRSANHSSLIPTLNCFAVRKFHVVLAMKVVPDKSSAPTVPNVGARIASLACK